MIESDKIKKVIVSDYSDGFAVDLFFKDGRQIETFTFDHNEPHENLKNLFKAIGIKEVVYQEVC
jgi:hypothetical protein